MSSISLDPFTSDALSTPHGFFTRRGGVSTGIYSSLNCGRGAKNDPAENVGRNRARVAAHLDVPLLSLVSLSQVHSATAILVRIATMPRLEGDAMVTTQKGIGLGILTADCTPVLFHDPQAGVIGAAHAGWRGATNGVLQATVDLMCTQGAILENIQAAIGPTIQQHSYEVDQKFYDNLAKDHPKIDNFFVQGTREKHLLFDLPGFVKQTLKDTGLCKIADLYRCTYQDEENFFSYRRATHRGETDYGRQISAITL